MERYAYDCINCYLVIFHPLLLLLFQELIIAHTMLYQLQVRDFFTSQRSRVRKLVRLSREKAIRANAHREPQDGVPTSSDTMTPIDPVPLNSVGPDLVPLNSVSSTPVPLNTVGPDPVCLNTVGISSVEDTPSCSKQDDTLPGLDNLDKHFVENVFDMLRKEETFSGQVKLMEWILQIQNPSVLNWYSLIHLMCLRFNKL